MLTVQDERKTEVYKILQNWAEIIRIRNLFLYHCPKFLIYIHIANLADASTPKTPNDPDPERKFNAMVWSGSVQAPGGREHACFLPCQALEID